MANTESSEQAIIDDTPVAEEVVKVDPEGSRNLRHELVISRMKLPSRFKWQVSYYANARMEYISFNHFEKYNSIFRFFTDKAVEFEIIPLSQLDLAIKFKNCRVDERLLKPLDTSEFDSLVRYMKVEQHQLPTKNVIVRLRLKKPCTLKIDQKKNVVHLRVYKPLLPVKSIYAEVDLPENSQATPNPNHK